MHSKPRDVASIRLDNALALFDEFVRNTVKDPDAATLRGLERRFAERLQIQPSYWSQIKSRSRQIGERLARQFELQCRKPPGWMDQAHSPGVGAAAAATHAAPRAAATGVPKADSPLPQDDDERFIVGLVLTYYRRHPQRARTRLLDLLGEVLVPAPPPPAPPKPPGPGNWPAEEDSHDVWARSAQGVAPLKRKK